MRLADAVKRMFTPSSSAMNGRFSVGLCALERMVTRQDVDRICQRAAEIQRDYIVHPDVCQCSFSLSLSLDIERYLHISPLRCSVQVEKRRAYVLGEDTDEVSQIVVLTLRCCVQ